ncbi:MAG: flagellar biosynthesis protein FlhB [Hyphomonadaceae bacterium]|nr:flagellar biosynthesis protein FlhB [Hyphomonadaceae bacterium]
MAEQNDDDKTEEPTPRKIEQAREKGDIVYTAEVGAALSLLATTAIIAFMAGPIVTEFARSFVSFVAMPDQYSAEGGALRELAGAVGLKVGAVLGLAMLALSAAGLASRYLQDRPTFTGERLTPKLNKLNPVEGFKRVFGKQAFAQFLKSMAKLVIVGAAMMLALWPHDAALENISLLDPAALLPFVQDRAIGMLIAVAVAAALLAVIDYIFTRQSYRKRLRMSRREIKEEMRQSEGDPMVKAKLRQIRQERARTRMMANMPNASVVITNPTHYAVALRYEQGETAAPICLAKGVDAVAQRIREAAQEHDIPIVEDPPLARALFASADIDEPIPREHYEAVAKVIGFVMRMARRRGRRRAN